MKKSHIFWLCLGILLLLGPLWGFPFVALAMLSAFRAESAGQPMDEQALASGIANATLPTFIGFIACPIGIAIIVVVIIQHIRLRKLLKESPEETK